MPVKNARPELVGKTVTEVSCQHNALVEAEGADRFARVDVMEGCCAAVQLHEHNLLLLGMEVHMLEDPGLRCCCAFADHNLLLGMEVHVLEDARQ